MQRLVKTAVLGLALATAGCGPARQPPAQLKGKGSTFVHPLMVQLASAYQKTENGCRIDYDPFGSGAGVKDLLANEVDFACTDAPLSDDQLAQAGGGVLHVPLVLGAVVAAYNLAEVSEPLRFSGPVLADIYLGKVTRWNDPALKDLNPDIAARLPDRGIHVVRRSDDSGTTYIWTDYLAKVSPAWREKVGVGTRVEWPVGAAEAGNDGVANAVKRTGGSLGYVELSYAYRKGLPFGLVRNRAGQFVKAGLDSVEAAAAQALTAIPDDLRYSLTDAPGEAAYPISGTTWVVVHSRQPAEKGQQLLNFLYWALGDGQEQADLLFYLRLPAPLRQRALAQLAKVKVGQAP